MELSDIDARIAQLKEQIALKEAAQKQIKESYQNPYSKYHYGYIFDAVAGDRSGLDKEAAEEAAYQKMLMEQAQADKIRAEQAYNTAYENDLNRKNALKLAEQNKATELETKKDEYIRGRNKAASVLDYAQQALAQDPNNIQLQKEVKLAKEDFDFYDRKLGGQGYDNIAVQTEQTSEGLNNKQIDDIVKAIVGKKEYTDADRNKLKVLKEFVTDPAIKEQIETAISNKKATKEDKDRELSAAIDNFKKTGKNPDTTKFKVKFKDNKPYTLIRR